MLILENIPLAPLTTLGVGGPARYLVDAQTENDVMEAVAFARSRAVPLFVLGGGSNLVVADAGFPGLMLKVGLTDLAVPVASLDRLVFDAGAGCEWDAFVARTVEAGCAGLECLSGIPGTVGGTPVQNVGAYGQEVSTSLQEVRALDLQSMQIMILSNAECRFAYRSSIFNTTERERYIILRVTYMIQRGTEPSLRYPDLQQHFAGQSATPTVLAVRQAVREIRRRKAMLIVASDDDAHSVGSFFKNPVVSQSWFEDLSQRLASRGLQPPSYSATDGYRKLPAAWLVEQAGFAKGYIKGRVGISRKHALAIINRGGATAGEIIALKDEIQKRVFEEFGIKLEPEPVFVGFDR